ncbi:hypothetical protein [Priestia megaterium]
MIKKEPFDVKKLNDYALEKKGLTLSSQECIYLAFEYSGLQEENKRLKESLAKIKQTVNLYTPTN